MKTQNNQLFPLCYGTKNRHKEHEDFDGLTKREYFAAMAMQGLLSTMSGDSNLNIKGAECIAKESLLAADELLKKLSNDSPDLFKDMGMDSVKIDF